MSKSQHSVLFLFHTELSLIMRLKFLHFQGDELDFIVFDRLNTSSKVTAFSVNCFHGQRFLLQIKVIKQYGKYMRQVLWLNAC